MTQEAEHPPIRFTFEPEGVAGLFLLKHCGACAGKEAQDELADLFKSYWKGGYDTAKAES